MLEYDQLHLVTRVHPIVLVQIMVAGFTQFLHIADLGVNRISRICVEEIAEEQPAQRIHAERFARRHEVLAEVLDLAPEVVGEDGSYVLQEPFLVAIVDQTVCEYS